MRTLLLMLVLCGSLRLTGQSAGCASTPEAAAQLAFAAVQPVQPARAASGYRVQDVQVDRLTHRVWLRVRRCDDDAAPAVLVPMHAGIVSKAGAAASPGASSAAALRVEAPLPTERHTPAVHVGDRVRVVVATASMHMEMDGRALEQVGVGDEIAVVLGRVGDEPEHRIRGTLRAQHIVEVQP